MKKTLAWVGGIVGFFALLFILGLFELGWYKFFEPKKENIRREVFENTKSFTHGKLQDLAKYFKEYNESDEAGKETIKIVVQSQFADFDESKIESEKLKLFLINMRGY